MHLVGYLYYWQMGFNSVFKGLSLVRLCDSDFGITPVDNITIGITCAAFCFHIAHISFASSWYLFYYYYYYGHYYYYYYYYYFSF